MNKNIAEEKLKYPNQNNKLKSRQMESQQDTVDLTINDDDDCLFPPELGETAGSLLELDEMVGNKETAKQNNVKQDLSQEDDTLSICGLEDSEITTDREEEKEEENSKEKVIFKRIWPNLGKKAKKGHIQICCI